MGMHIGATWRIRLNRPCASAKRRFCQITLMTGWHACWVHAMYSDCVSLIPAAAVDRPPINDTILCVVECVTCVQKLTARQLNLRHGAKNRTNGQSIIWQKAASPLHVDGRSFLCFTVDRPFPQNCPFPWGIWTPSNTWFLGLTTPNGIYIGSAVFAGLTIVTDRQIDRQTTLLRL